MIKIASSELNATKNDDMVKVAGILQKIKDWYKSVFDPEYRNNIEELKNQSSSLFVHFNQLSKYIEKVNKAISTGDVDSYNYSLDQVKEISKILAKEFDEYEGAIDKAKAPVDKSSNTIDVVKFTDSVKNITKSIIKLNLSKNNIPEEDINEIIEDSNLFNKLIEAIRGGKVLGSKAAKPSKQRENREGELWVEIETSPIDFGNVIISFVFIVTDLSARTGETHIAKPQFSVMKIVKMNVLSKKTASFNKLAYNVVPMKTTPASMAQVAQSLVSILGSEATKESIAWMVAQIALETGNGRSIQNYNVGNISCWPSYQGNAWRPPWFNPPTEESSKRDKYLYNEMINKRAPSAFKAYSSLDEGIGDYVQRLKRNFPEILQAHKSDDPDEIFAAIRKKYMPDRMSSEKEDQSKQNLLLLKQKYEKLPVISSLPSVKSLPQTEENVPNIPFNIKELANYLGVSLATKPLTTLVKMASMPKSESNNVYIITSGDKLACAEYSYILSECLERSLGITANVCKSDSGFVINCKSDDNKETLSKAINSVHKIVSNRFYNTYKTNVSAGIKLNIDNIEKVSMVQLDKDRKKFLLKVM